MKGESKIAVTGMGVVSPLGDSAEELHGALWEGRSALRPLELFDTEKLSTRIAAELEDFDARSYLGKANLRPLDRTGQLVIVAAQLALEASGWDAEARERQEVGLVLGTMFGSVRTIAEFDRRAQVAGPIYAKPLDFANTVINAAAGQTAIWHDLRGINSTISGGPSAALQAIGYAADLIRGGRSRVLLAGGADELCFESFWGFQQAGLLALSKNGRPERPVPFDAQRNGLALGEGSALLVLEDEEGARERGATIYAEVGGHGNCFDPSRGADDESATRALEGAVALALEASGLEPGDLDAVAVSANGSPRGDRQEALGLARALGEDAAGRLPVLAVKAQLGEALGASGAYQAVALLESLRTGRLPGIAGLEAAEPGLPLGGISAVGLELPSRGDEPRHGLLVGRGLDGNVCALVLQDRRGLGHGGGEG